MDSYSIENLISLLIRKYRLILVLVAPIFFSSVLNWIYMWVFLEISTISFIFYLTLFIKNVRKLDFQEGLVKYFLIQAMASLFLLVSFIWRGGQSFWGLDLTFSSGLFWGVLILKLGLVPFHFWVPPVGRALSYWGLFLLLGWQKLIPLILLFNCLGANLNLMGFCLIISIIWRTMCQYNVLNLKLLLVYSSIAHISWLGVCSFLGAKLALIYYSVYIIIIFLLFHELNKLNLFYLLDVKYLSVEFFLLLNLFSLRGLPPFLGFFPKWAILINGALLFSNLFWFVFLAIRVLGFYIYIRIIFPILRGNWGGFLYFRNAKWNFILLNLHFFLPILLLTF